MGFSFVLFVVLVGGGWLLVKIVGGIMFPDRNERDTFIDKSVHHHHYHYDNRSVHINGEEFKNLK